MKKGKAGFENRGLVILLCVLVVAIAGLGAGIGVVLNRHEIDDSPVTNTVNEFIDTGRPVDADYVLDLIRAAEDFDDVEEGIRLYEDVIAANMYNVSDLLSLRISYSKFLLNSGYTDAGFEQLNLVEQDELDVVQKIKLYIAYRNMYIYVQDMNMAKYYNDEIDRLMRENNISENAEF